MSKKMRQTLLQMLTLVVILSFSIAPASKTQAKASDPSDVVVLQSEQAAPFTEATVDAITKGSAKHIADNSALNDKEATVYTVGGGVTVVTIPLNESYSLPSNITVFLDEEKSVLQTNEMLVTKNKQGNFQVETYVDGALSKSVDTGRAFMTDAALLAEKPAPSDVQPMGVGSVAGCLAGVLGVGGTTAYIIAAACGGACTVPTPVTAPICAACIGAYATIGGASITGVVACFALA